MRNFKTLILAALVAASTAPALAAWDRVGSVDFSRQITHDAQLGNFKGEAVTLTARGNDVMCDRVMATFGNGRTRDIFHGELLRGNSVTIDLPGNQRSIDRIDFDCRPLDGWRARVDIAADTYADPYDNPRERLGFNYPF